MDYFRLFYEYFEEKVSDFLFVKSGSVIIFFLYNLVANFAREYESSHDRLTAHINVLVRALIYISALVLVDSRTFKYCFNITRPGNNLDNNDHWSFYHVYGILYKVFYVYYFKAVLYDWRKLIIKCFCNSYSNNWESKRFKNSYSMKLIK